MLIQNIFLKSHHLSMRILIIEWTMKMRLKRFWKMLVTTYKNVEFRLNQSEMTPQKSKAYLNKIIKVAEKTQPVERFQNQCGETVETWTNI